MQWLMHLGRCASICRRFPVVGQRKSVTKLGAGVEVEDETAGTKSLNKIDVETEESASKLATKSVDKID